MNPATTRVTAVMITGKDDRRYPLAMESLVAFLEQEYPGPREILIINDSNQPITPKNLYPPDVGKIRELMIEPGRNLGELRNLAFDFVHDGYMVQWDDDDFSSAERLKRQVTATQAGQASILKWELHINLLTSQAFANNGEQIRTKGFPGTMLFPAETKTRFPATGKGEDTEFLLRLDHELVVLDNDPTWYNRFYHGHNTWDERHVMQRKRGSRDLNRSEAAWVNLLLKTRYRRIQEELRAQAD